MFIYVYLTDVLENQARTNLRLFYNCSKITSHDCKTKGDTVKQPRATISRIVDFSRIVYFSPGKMLRLNGY